MRASTVTVTHPDTREAPPHALLASWITRCSRDGMSKPDHICARAARAATPSGWHLDAEMRRSIDLPPDPHRGRTVPRHRAGAAGIAARARDRGLEACVLVVKFGGGIDTERLSVASARRFLESHDGGMFMRIAYRN